MARSVPEPCRGAVFQGADGERKRRGKEGNRMKDAFICFFQNACSESCNEALVRNAEGDPEYKEAAKRYNELFANVRERLGEENKELLFNLEISDSEKESLQEKWIYRRAFQDCFYLLQWMGAFRKD